MNGREVAGRFGVPGELIYIVGSRADDPAETVKRLERAVGGKLARCLRSCGGGISATLADAASDTVEASVRIEAFDDAPLPDAYIASIRKEDRERFEETVSGVRARWIGETIWIPTGLSAPKQGIAHI